MKLLIILLFPLFGCSQQSIPFDGKERAYQVNAKNTNKKIFCCCSLTSVSGKVISFKFVAKQGAMIGFKTLGIYNMYYWISDGATVVGFGDACGQDVALAETKLLGTALTEGKTYTISCFIQTPYNLKLYVIGFNYFKY